MFVFNVSPKTTVIWSWGYSLVSSNRLEIKLEIPGFQVSGLSTTQWRLLIRAYPGSEFVVANTLAKWKTLEPNEINFGQGFSQKVSTSCFLFDSLPTIFANSLDPDQAQQNVGPDLYPNCLTHGWY